jgi:hypothetical protein
MWLIPHQRRERSIAYRLRNACFAETKTLEELSA